jgi:hypothetical protein
MRTLLSPIELPDPEARRVPGPGPPAPCTLAWNYWPSERPRGSPGLPGVINGPVDKWNGLHCTMPVRKLEARPPWAPLASYAAGAVTYCAGLVLAVALASLLFWLLGSR